MVKFGITKKGDWDRVFGVYARKNIRISFCRSLFVC